MLYALSPTAVTIFIIFVASVLGLSFFLASRAKSAKGYFAAHGEIPWFINGIAFAGDYLSAASFLGICGLVAFFGYDGLLYSIGFLAGWVVALFVIAEPIKRLGKFTFADALDSQFNSRGIKLTAAISTLVVSTFYLIPQMVGAGALIKPLLGIPIIHLGPIHVPPFTTGVVLVGTVVILIVVTAGMVSTTWVQFIKGSLLVLFCSLISILVLNRGLNAKPDDQFPRTLDHTQFEAHLATAGTVLPRTGPWEKIPYTRIQRPDGSMEIWRVAAQSGAPSIYTECQVRNVDKNGERYVNGKPQTLDNDLKPVGFVARLPNNAEHTGPVSPTGFLATFQDSSFGLPASQVVKETDGSTSTIYFAHITPGQDVLLPGGNPTLFKGVKSKDTKDRLNFISLMLALFCGTAALPHVLIRYYTVKNQSAARKSTIVGIVAIGLFYILTLFLGLGAMTSNMLDPTDSNMSAPLLAKSFGDLLFAFISALAFTTVLGTVSGLIMAASGAVAHDLLNNLFKLKLDDRNVVKAGKIASIAVGVVAIVLGILFQKMNVSFLVGWAFNIAASANLPAITMLLFWKRTTMHGIAASILVGMLSSLLWIFLSADAYVNIYGLPATAAPIPFNQPAIVTIPLAYLTLFLVSLATRNTRVQPQTA